MKILFQGDSITDAARDRSDPQKQAGYTQYVKDALGEGNEYYNLGISGDLTCDLLARYDSDKAVVSPDVYTLLIGINDIWRRFTECRYTSAEQYARNVRELLTKVKADNPGVKIIILEPFLLPAADKEYWAPTLGEFLREIRGIAVELADGYIPLDGIFAKQLVENKGLVLSADGVHPNDLGNRIIAKHLIEEIRRVAAK